MKGSLTGGHMTDLVERIGGSDRELTMRYPGERAARQPVHTVYGGAHLFRADSASKLGAIALRALDGYAPDPVSFAVVLGLQGAERLPRDPTAIAALAAAVRERPDEARRTDPAAWLAVTVYDRVQAKLVREPVEDFRIDFEDGYGNRPDDQEDAEALRTASEVARGMRDGTLPPFVGIRIKPFNMELGRRALRTLDLFVTELVSQSGGGLPDHFVVTLPKVTRRDQVLLLAEALGALEERLGLSPSALKLELMVEMPQAIVSAEGTVPLPAFIHASDGRCVAAHFGTYDYTAGCSITAAHQHMMHPACDFAKHVMQVSLAGTGIWLSDGATNVMPVPVHVHEGLDETQRQENRDAVHRSWRLHCSHIRHSMVQGFYQGWDLHPAQLPTRYGAVYGFFLESLDSAAERLRNFIDKAAQATLAGAVFDDAATGQGLLNFFLRAMSCGALTEEEATRLSGLSHEELRERSFARIVERRRDG